MDPHELKERLFLKEREKKGRLQQEEREMGGGAKKSTAGHFPSLNLNQKFREMPNKAARTGKALSHGNTDGL